MERGGGIGEGFFWKYETSPEITQWPDSEEVEVFDSQEAWDDFVLLREVLWEARREERLDFLEEVEEEEEEECCFLVFFLWMTGFTPTISREDDEFDPVDLSSLSESEEESQRSIIRGGCFEVVVFVVCVVSVADVGGSDDDSDMLL